MLATTTPEPKIYELLRARFSDEETLSLMEFIESKTEKAVSNQKVAIATREDLFTFEKGFRQDIHESETRLRQTVQQVDYKTGQLESRLLGVNANIIKWMFLFWLTQLAAIVAIVKLLA